MEYNQAKPFNQGIYYNNRYTYPSCWNVFLKEKSWRRQQPIDLRHFKVFSFAMACINKKVADIFVCHVTFCVQTQYL